jgi:hypothetical protein
MSKAEATTDDPGIDMDELERTIGTLCAASDGYGDRLEHMSTIIKMCHDRELPANAIKPKAEMDIIRYGISTAATRRRLTKTVEQERKKRRSDVSPDAPIQETADELLQVFVDYADDLAE